MKTIINQLIYSKKLTHTIFHTKHICSKNIVHTTFHSTYYIFYHLYYLPYIKNLM